MSTTLGPWGHAWRIAGWQLLGAFAMFAVATALDVAASVELPRSISGVALLVGAQAYTAGKELNTPGAIMARRMAVAARAALITTGLQTLLAALVIALMAHDPDLERMVDWGAANPWILPVVIAIAYAAILGLTWLGVWFGGSTARKAAARKRAGAPRR